MTNKQSTKKGGAKGKAGSRGKKRATVKDRARAIVADVKGYDDDTRRAIQTALDEEDSYLAELVRRAEAGDTILDVRGPFEDAEAEQFKAGAVAYARKAYDAALAHFEANHADPLALSRLAVVEGADPRDVHIIVTLPGVVDGNIITAARAREAISDAEVIARTLEHEGSTEAFGKACSAIMAEHVCNQSGVDWFTSPQTLRVMLPLILFDLWQGHDASADTPVDILVTLSNELVSDETATEVRNSMGLQ